MLKIFYFAIGNVIFKSHVFELMLNNKNLKFNVANHYYILETTSFFKSENLNE
jgi:hypothetical protein